MGGASTHRAARNQFVETLLHRSSNLVCLLVFLIPMMETGVGVVPVPVAAAADLRI